MLRLQRFRHILCLPLNLTVRPCSHCLSCNIRKYSSKKASKENNSHKIQEENDKKNNDTPEKFLRSKAHRTSFSETFLVEEPIPWYQFPIIAMSFLSFVIYIFYIREENDIDIQLNTLLNEDLPAIEEIQGKLDVEQENIQRELDVAQANNKDTKELKLKLAYLRQCKEEVKQEMQDDTQTLEHKSSSSN